MELILKIVFLVIIALIAWRTEREINRTDEKIEKLINFSLHQNL